MRTNTKVGGLIVVGVDGSARSIEALQWAVRQADLTGATVRVVAAWHWPSLWGWGLPLAPPRMPAEEAQAALDAVLVPARAEHPELTIESVAVESHPAAALIEASRDADLLVVGSRGLGEFAGLLLGSVSERCASGATCPVLVVRDGKG